MISTTFEYTAPERSQNQQDSRGVQFDYYTTIVILSGAIFQA